MKQILLAVLFGLSSGSMMGQTRIIKGTVMEKKTGDSLPGTEVSVEGGAESTVTDADGTFTLEVGQNAKRLSVRYAGMQTQKVKITGDEMLIQMSERSDSFYFLNVEGGLVSNKWSDVNGSVGLMVGKIGKWGFYGKGMMTPWADDFMAQAMLGVTKRVFPRMHVSFGAGIGLGCQNRWSADEKEQVSEEEFLLEPGVIFMLSRHLSVNVNYSVGICMSSGYHQFNYGYTDGVNHNISLGIGYVF